MDGLSLRHDPERLQGRLRGFPAGHALVIAAVTLLILVAMALAPTQRSWPGLGPASAEAAQGGWDRDHWWLKVTRGEILSGAVSGICGRYVPKSRAAQVCTPVAQAVRQTIGNNRGVWVEVWPPYCTNSRWVWQGGRLYFLPAMCYPPRMNIGTW
jgi:hypothetical protein